MVMQKAFMASAFFKHWMRAENRKGHGVHSPFVFDFIQTVLHDARHFYAFDDIEQVRTAALQNQQVLNVTDFGAGSHTGAGHQRTVASIMKHAARTPAQGRFLFRLMQRYGYSTVVELGTSLGMGTSYLASANAAARIHTLEGCSNIAAQAQQHFNALQLKNIHSTQGNFDDTLLSVLQNIPSLDVFFVDGNHREEPTLRYFTMALPYMHEQGVMIFDDIHWSRGMQAAWEQIKQHPRVRLSLDLFYVGLVFFDPAFKEKQDFSLFL
jgi:predicted O-methyltransferase YrrM